MSKLTLPPTTVIIREHKYEVSDINKSNSFSHSEKKQIPAIVFVSFACCVILLFSILLIENNINNQYLQLCIIIGIVMLIPTFYYIAIRKFDLFNPLIYPVLTYLLPVFTFGGIYETFNQNPSWILGLIPNSDQTLLLSLFYILIGFLGLVAGFLLPFGRVFGIGLSRHFPRWQWKPEVTIISASIVTAIGSVFSIYSYAISASGYVTNLEEISSGGILRVITSLGGFGSFLILYCYLVRPREKHLNWWPYLLLPIGMMVFSLLVGGSRGTLIGIATSLVCVLRFSGRKIKPSVWIALLLITILALPLMTIGNSYRIIKGSEASISLDESITIGYKAVEATFSRPYIENLTQAFEIILGRSTTLASFAVVVANYEQLRPYEAQYGLENNIWTYTWAALIPRSIWPDKPLISDARSMGALYFDFPTNSFATTIFGDLLRNFGPIGIPIGLALLGLFFRMFYVALVENQQDSIWRSLLYLQVIGINYEGFIGTILPGWIISFLSLLLFAIIINASNHFLSRKVIE